MKFLNDYGMRLVLMAVLVVIMAISSSARADFIFGEPTIVLNINSEFSDGAPQISRDGLELYFISKRPSLTTGTSLWRIWVSSQPTTREPWSTPVELGMPANFAGSVQTPSLSGDGLELYFSDGVLNQPNPSGLGNSDIWVMTRTDRDAPWGEPVNLGTIINTEYDEDTPCISANGLELYYAVNVPDHPKNSELFMATRPNKAAPWGEPVNLGPNVNSDQYEFTPFISSDGLLLYFSRGYSKSHIWVCRRAKTADPWGPAEFFSPVNSGNANNVWTNSPGSAEYCLSFATGDPMLYFSRGADAFGTDYKIWQIEVTPVVDFNGDDSVDTLDIYELVDHWGRKDESLYDIAPAPFGDGIVDVRDLKVLTEHIEPVDRTLIAHWELDETEGITAYDSVGGNDGYAMGGPVWQPARGAVGGAVELDGVDDYVITGSVLSSAHSPFSIFAWIKGGGYNQVVVSQTMRANWLMADDGGRLITELTSSSGFAGPLLSQMFITDGKWHLIGLAWDGLYRKLYVDGVVAAEDTQENVDVGNVGLYIGAGKNAEPGTYWSGLIDDVRIYDRLLSAEEIFRLMQ
jgi:hypothetical protein